MQIPQYRNYYIQFDSSGLPIIISKTGWRGQSQRELKIHINRNGYRDVRLCNEYGSKRHHVARLVLLTFDYKDNHSKFEAHHIDGDRQNDRLDNLVWISHRGNMFHVRKNSKAILATDEFNFDEKLPF